MCLDKYFRQSKGKVVPEHRIKAVECSWMTKRQGDFLKPKVKNKQACQKKDIGTEQQIKKKTRPARQTHIN